MPLGLGIFAGVIRRHEVIRPARARPVPVPHQADDQSGIGAGGSGEGLRKVHVQLVKRRIVYHLDPVNRWLARPQRWIEQRCTKQVSSLSYVSLLFAKGEPAGTDDQAFPQRTDSH